MRRLIIGMAALVLVAGCREGDATGPGTNTLVLITSEPAGGRIYVDGTDTGVTTPDTVGIPAGIRDVHVRLDTMGVRYEYNALLSLEPSDSVRRLHGPLAVQCAFSADLSSCHRRLHRYHTAAGMRFASSPLGSLFLYEGSGQGLFWPSNSTNSYLSGGIPVFAGVVSGVPVALGIYDHGYLAGRPTPEIGTLGGSFMLRQRTWVVPPTSGHLRLTTVRGIEVRQEITAVDAVSGVIRVRLTFRNVSGQLEYRLIDPFVGEGVLYQDVYIGLALDPDIGESTDDWLSYDPALSMAFVYDSRFGEPVFTGAAATAPGLVGLRALEVPEGTSVVLNGWARTSGPSDWSAGTVTEAQGHGMLSGKGVYPPAHSDPRIGHLPTLEGDMRISVTAGPLSLAPGQEASMVLAIAVAAPAPGTFDTGSLVQPGDPTDTGRALYRIAALLRERMLAAGSAGGH